MHLLLNSLRPYAWGSSTAIAELLGRTPSGGPEAELWIGAHPDSPSRVLAAPDDGGPGLDDVIAQDPEGLLGAASVAAFGPRLPFLLKVLAADRPLSLQVHPTLQQAQAGFAAEEAAGVDRAAAHRNYKDDNHKPEMIFALSPFEALCGFRAPAEAAARFEALTALLAGHEAAEVTEQVAEILRGPDAGEALRTAFARLIAGGEQVRDAVRAAAAAVARAVEAEETDDAGLRTVVDLAREYPDDPGVLISLLLNRVSLAPGEALALGAGNVHAYLSGLGIEVMASSDNVLRGGLTPKHVDVAELLETVAFEALPVPLLASAESELGQELYRPPFAEFQLQRIHIPAGAGAGAAEVRPEPVPVAQAGAAVVLVLDGSLTLDTPKGDLVLTRGDAAFVPDAEAPALAHAGDGGVLAFAVTTGLGAGIG
ncbi:mannose-6-phosphate isomerase, class I [Sinomonas sp. ASV322]|uniref:mannose-6-phosphate isomerase, class I n=1 Tax=Sinomonas sp. ASV322 TaxID=3041920 RepID=UPI0027DC0CC3|nr:mannose-6-phosphate isomerase, class I [Sinomonas sp. ASV322]MDQ4503688.1 mannose-6-phosphate isomerase, class I [Sinomonas sp. ASV322]